MEPLTPGISLEDFCENFLSLVPGCLNLIQASKKFLFLIRGLNLYIKI